MLMGLGLAPAWLDTQALPLPRPLRRRVHELRADLCQMPREAGVARSPALREARQLEQGKVW